MERRRVRIFRICQLVHYIDEPSNAVRPPENRPADWKQQMNRWDRFHYVRVAVIIAAFALLVAALA